MAPRPLLVWLCLFIGTIEGVCSANDQDLAGYFGFEGLEVVKIGRQAGPLTAADLDGDGLTDLIAVNNHASRIELHYQKPDASPDDAFAAPVRVNEFPPHWRFRRAFLPVTHLVAAVVPHDFDGDGRLDLVYAGYPEAIVFVRQSAPGTFEVTARHRVKSLAANRDGLAIADVVDDRRPELLALVDGSIVIWRLEADAITRRQELSAGEDVVAFVLEDFTGDGRTDVVGIIPNDPAPVRLWLGETEGAAGVINAQIRFEMPALQECTALRLLGRAAAQLAVIERASKRLVIYDVASEEVDERGDRDAAIRVHGFTDAGNRQRDHAVFDVDGDGLLDLVATDTEASALVVYGQRRGKGMQEGQSYPSLSDLTHVVAGNVDDDPFAELFVLSEKEGVVGRCDVSPDGVPFPLPLPISEGRTPTALNLVALQDGPRVAVVAKDGRDYVIDLVRMNGEAETIELGKLSRSPETILALDADQDGRTDLLLFTRDKPMTMLRATDDGFALTESGDMGQYGLVKAAQAQNTAVFDIDGDGRPELLIADKNYVRSVRYESDPQPGVSAGWQVVRQVNARDSASRLVSVAVLGGRVVAADKENARLIVMDQAPDGAREWGEIESLAIRGFSFTAIHAGGFSGDEESDILAVGEDGFAVIRLRGQRIALREFTSWRTSEERRVQHELGYGDVNSDGFTDMISLDAGEQMCEVFTFSESGRMLYATGFQVFESRMFSGGEPREYQPSQILIVDVTGDGCDDLILLAHDRVLIYPQMTAPPAP